MYCWRNRREKKRNPGESSKAHIRSAFAEDIQTQKRFMRLCWILARGYGRRHGTYLRSKSCNWKGAAKYWVRSFFGCAELKEIIIPYSVMRIGREAFAGCKSLTQITLPKGCKPERGAFPKGCKVKGGNRGLFAKLFG